MPFRERHNHKLFFILQRIVFAFDENEEDSTKRSNGKLHGIEELKKRKKAAKTTTSTIAIALK